MDPITFNMILIASKARMAKIIQQTNGADDHLLIELKKLAGLEGVNHE